MKLKDGEKILLMDLPKMERDHNALVNDIIRGFKIHKMKVVIRFHDKRESSITVNAFRNKRIHVQRIDQYDVYDRKAYLIYE